jgi:hypothetical protein
MVRAAQSPENERQIEVAVYEPSPGDRVRITLEYQKTWRGIFWLTVQKDGSIYLGPRLTSISEIKKGVSTLEAGNQVIRYDERQHIADHKILKQKGKISFHASGAINATGERLYRVSLRNLKDQQELCRALFRHPQQFASIDKIEPRDICLNYPIDEKRALQAILFVAPTEYNKVVRVKDAAYQLNCCLVYRGLIETSDLFYRSSCSMVPSYPGLLTPTYFFNRIQGYNLKVTNQQIDHLKRRSKSVVFESAAVRL